MTLVEQLRSVHVGLSHRLALEAADHIEKLEATVEQLQELLDCVEDDLGGDYIDAFIDRS